MILPSLRWFVVGARHRCQALPYQALLGPLQLAYLAGPYTHSVEARVGRAQPAVNRVVLANSLITVGPNSITSFGSEF